MKMKEVMTVVVKTISIIRSGVMDHRDFQEYLEELNGKFGDVFYYSEVRWLNRESMLKPFYQLRREINELMIHVKKTGCTA